MHITNVEEYLSVHEKRQIWNGRSGARVDKYYGNRYDKADGKSHSRSVIADVTSNTSNIGKKDSRPYAIYKGIFCAMRRECLK